MKHLFIIIFVFSNTILANYSEHPEAQEFIKTLVSEHGFDQSYVLQILQSAKKQERILESMSSPAEFTWTWDRYKKLFLEVKRIINGKKFISENYALLVRVENEFGVPREIISTIIGVETSYG